MSEWKLVPCEPEYEMLNAAIDVDSYKLGDISPLGFRESPQRLFARCYAAMLAASPPAPDVMGALEYYADPRTYERFPTTVTVDGPQPITIDRGAAARAVLAQLKGEKL